MTPRLKKILLIVAIGLTLLISSAIVVAAFNEDKIRRIAIEQLNSILSTEVKVEKIDFSLLRRFPSASIQFKNIAIQESSSRKDKKDLLKASSLFLEFNPFDLLTENFVVKDIYVEDCELNIEYFKDGSNNFQFFNVDEGDDSFELSLKKVVLTNALINYLDVRSAITFSANTKRLLLSGDFESDEFDLNLSSNGIMNVFKLKNLKTKQAYPFDLDLVINVQRETNLYSIKKARTTFDKIPLSLNGDFQKFENSSQMNLSFHTESFKFKDAMFLIPAKSRMLFSKYNARGTLDVKGTIKGKLDYKNSPAIDLTYSLEKGELNHNKLNISLKNIVFKGSFSNGAERNNKTSTFIIEEASLDGQYGKSKGELSISNFDKPYLKFELSSALDLSRFKESIENDSLEILEGFCEYSIRAETYLDSLSSIGLQDVKEAKAEGYLNIEFGKIKWPGYKNAIENITAKTRFGNNMIHIDSMNYSIAGVSSSLSGKLHNLLPFIFFNNEKLTAQVNLFYPDLDLNKMLTSNEGDEKSGFFLPVSDLIKLKVNLKADNFEMRKFKANNISCVITSDFPNFLVQNLSLDAMQGQFNGWMRFDLINESNIQCASSLSLKHVNIKDLFYQFDEFGQSAIESKNLFGYANSEIDFFGAFDREFNIKQESVECISHLEIRNGRLVDYEPILALSKYVDVEELKDISFSKLTNDIEIKDRMIFIPEMDIKSSALELKLSGKHSFDNEIDYHFRLWLNDVLFKKAKKSKKNKEEFGEVEVDEKGRAKLYMRMTGTVDDYKIKMDRKAIRDKWKDDFQEERKEIKELFKNEFSDDKKEKEVTPIDIGIEWEEFEDEEEVADSTSAETKKEEKKGKKKKSFLEKIGKDVDDEYEEYDEEKFD